jgi:hypothetical protein
MRMSKDIPAFCFIDESGVLEKDSRQPYFAMGFLFIEDTSELVENLALLKDRMKSSLGEKSREFEFKFTRITYETAHFYKQLIDLILSSKLKVVIFLVDKTDSRIDPGNYFSSVWDAYIVCAKTVIKHKAGNDKSCIVIADYFSRPKWNNRKFETELRSLSQVINATMLESHSSMLIQAIDVLTGCVRYSFEKKITGPESKKISVKMDLVMYLSDKLGRTSLADNFLSVNPIHFEVWKYERK